MKLLELFNKKDRNLIQKVLDRKISPVLAQNRYLSSRIRKYQPRKNSVVILNYHEANKVNLKYHFKKFRQEFSVIPYRNLVSEIYTENPQLPNNALAITFDDGHADNYKSAFPLMKKFSIPATIFQTTFNIGEPLWTAELKANNLSSKKTREKSTENLKRFIKELRDKHDYDALKKVGRRLLSPEEIREMSNSSLVSFGCHSHSHLDLTYQSRNSIENDIEKNYKILFDITGTKPKHFCYPFGAFNDTTLEVVRQFGFKSASTTIPGVNREPGNPYAIQRINGQSNLKKVLIKIRLQQILNDFALY